MALDLAKYIKRFIEDARDNVVKLNEGLLTLENHTGGREELDTVFRIAHTIKGSARMMKLVAISNTAHGMEDVLDALRGRQIDPSPRLFSALFKGVDAIAAMLDIAERDGDVLSEDTAVLQELSEILLPENSKHPQFPQEDLVDKSTAVANEVPIALQAFLSAQANEPAVQSHMIEPGEPQPEAVVSEPVADGLDTLRVSTSRLDTVINIVGEMAGIQSRRVGQRKLFRELEKLTEKHIRELDETGAFSVSPTERERHLKSAGVLLSMIRQLGSEEKKATLYQGQMLEELQTRAIEMRLLTFQDFFSGLKRMVRDLADECGKKIVFHAMGAVSEIDKKVLEKIGDALIHLVRNAIDHGIEMNDERELSGKPASGSVWVSARNEGDMVVLEIGDDGGGINVEHIRARALSLKIMSEQDAARMSESQLIDMIYLPGFTTSRIITGLSGRGVGMDIVRRIVVDELKGSLSLQTRKGSGTIFTLRVPLAIGTMGVMLVETGERRFAIPVSYIHELLSPQVGELIEVGGRKVVRLREQLIPVIRLRQVLGLPAGIEPDEKRGTILIVTLGETHMGLLVDRIIDEQEMMIKPLPAHIRESAWISGGIVTGGDEIVGVLNIPRMFRALTEERIAFRPAESAEAKSVFKILLVDDSVSTREIEKSILESHGYSVMVAADGQEALATLQRDTFDLLVTDIEMPHMDGFTLTQRLRSESMYQDLPVILVTSRDKEEDKRRGIQAGANAYIVKGSFEESGLIDTIRNILGG